MAPTTNTHKTFLTTLFFPFAFLASSKSGIDFLEFLSGFRNFISSSRTSDLFHDYLCRFSVYLFDSVSLILFFLAFCYFYLIGFFFLALSRYDSSYVFQSFILALQIIIFFSCFYIPKLFTCFIFQPLTFDNSHFFFTSHFYYPSRSTSYSVHICLICVAISQPQICLG